MLKFGNNCFVKDLDENLFPVDIAIGLQEIKNGNDVTEREDEVDIFKVIMTDGALSASETNDLHPDIQRRCANLNTNKFKEAQINASQDEDLKNGKIVFVSEQKEQSQCTVQVSVKSHF